MGREMMVKFVYSEWKGPKCQKKGEKNVLDKINFIYSIQLLIIIN